jgi:hypothetical protein
MSDNTFQIKVDFDPLPQVKRLMSIRGEVTALIAINRAAANGAAVVLRDHWLARNMSIQRRPGWPASNYWTQVAESVSTSADSNAGTVHVRHPGIYYHLKGGTITPTRGRYLAIPLQPENKGVWPSEKFPSRRGAFLLISKLGNKLLASSEGKGTARKLTLHYLLVESITKPADATVLPQDSVILEAASQAAEKMITRALIRNK